MNINLTFKNNSNIENNNEHVNLRSSQTIPFAHPLSPFNEKYEERPLKTSSRNLSFKGLSTTFPDVSRGVREYGNIFGHAAEEYFKNALDQAAKTSNSGLKVKDNTITFTEKTLIKKLGGVLIYPVTNLPLNSVNSLLTTLQKVPGAKDWSFVKGLYNSDLLTKQRIKMENISNVASIKHYFEKLDKESHKIFNKGHARFNTDKGDFDSAKERTTSRVVTGMPGALIYMKSDAHNTVIAVTGDKDKAEQEAKRRRRQELIRITITAAATFMVTKLFSKLSNKNAVASALLVMGITIVSEVLGRIIAGNPVLPLNKEAAIKLAKKRGIVKESQNNNSIEKSKSDSQNNTETLNNSDSDKKSAKTNKSDKLTVANISKVLGIMVLAGWVINKKLIKIKEVEEVLSGFKKNYKKLIEKDFIISREEFNRITQKLRDNGFDKIADKYNEIIKDQKGATLNLGKIDNKVAKFLINDLLSFPVKFTWNILMMPYKGVDKTIQFVKNIGKKTIEKELSAKEIKKEEMKSLKNSIRWLQKNDNAPNYQNKVNKKILDAFDNETKSGFSNAKGAGLTKNLASFAAGGCLLVDTQAWVMVNTLGEDKELAIQKTKERAAQRLFKMLFGGFLITLYTNAFAKIYNSSLLGAQIVNLCQVFTSETLERVSVGMPLHEATREEIIESERKNLSATGLKGKYFRAMAQITGKKPLTDSKVAA